MKIAYKLLLIFSLIIVILLLPQVTVETISHPLRLALILILITELTLFFKKLFFDGDKKPWIKNLATGILSTIIFLLLLETVFMFIPRSHAGGYTLAARLWHSKYWKLNSFGYRDKEPVTNKSEIFFIGDSFTKGQGIKNPKHRFPDIVEEKFKEKNKSVNTINLGVNGADTKSEYETMLNFIESSHIQPDFLVLQYLGNDIEEVAMKSGLKLNKAEPYHEMNFIFSKVVQGSYLLNYLYWFLPKSQDNRYINFVKEAYSNDSIFNRHARDLKLFIDYASSKRIPLLVVIFPLMQIVDLSNQLYGDKIKRFLDENGTNYLDISSLIKDISLKDRIVNSSDAHPSENVHRIVGNEIYNKIATIKFKNN